MHTVLNRAVSRNTNLGGILPEEWGMGNMAETIETIVFRHECHAVLCVCVCVLIDVPCLCSQNIDSSKLEGPLPKSWGRMSKLKSLFCPSVCLPGTVSLPSSALSMTTAFLVHYLTNGDLSPT